MKILLNFLVKIVIKNSCVIFDAFSWKNGSVFPKKKRRCEAKVLITSMCTFQSYILSKCNSNPGNTVYSICDKKLNYANKIIIYEFVNSSGNSSKHL